MPSWSPEWADVSFDAAGAEATVAALRTAAVTVDATTEARVRLAREAQRDWAGRARVTFDDELRRHVRAAADLAGACRAAAAAIEAASDEARIEQRRRERDRERWYDERAAEERARANAREAAGLPALTTGAAARRPMPI